jgi:Domain of unknown function (DUF4169)
MADIINLRRVRKQKIRDESADAAAANRAKFGRSKSEKKLAAAEQKLSQQNLDGHQRADKWPKT